MVIRGQLYQFGRQEQLSDQRQLSDVDESVSDLTLVGVDGNFDLVPSFGAGGLDKLGRNDDREGVAGPDNCVVLTGVAHSCSSMALSTRPSSSPMIMMRELERICMRKGSRRFFLKINSSSVITV